MPETLWPEVQRPLVGARENASVAGAADAVEVSAKRAMASDRSERSCFAHEDPRRAEGLIGRGNPFVKLGAGPGPARDGGRKYAAAVERGAAIGVDDVALGAGVGPIECAEKVLRDADGPHGVRSSSAEIRREVTVIPGPRCREGRRAGDCGKGDRNKYHEQLSATARSELHVSPLWRDEKSVRLCSDVPCSTIDELRLNNSIQWQERYALSDGYTSSNETKCRSLHLAGRGRVKGHS